ncbi:MAG TPA: plastocyanin/azurin family copper-binding protein [Dehalococcoidia bacterium]|nr:plastocyanin/azurin family copper-binding protein [Dehalococcoidia bacterium]
MAQWIVLLGLAVIGGLLWLACGDGEEAPPTGGAEVQVTLDEWSIKPNVSTVKAGPITFKADNRGAVAHELEIFSIGRDVDIAKLPLKASKADPEAVGAKEIGEIEEEDLPSKGKDEATFTLQSGRYLLICNIPAHYQQGMYAELKVE